MAVCVKVPPSLSGRSFCLHLIPVWFAFTAPCQTAVQAVGQKLRWIIDRQRLHQTRPCRPRTRHFSDSEGTRKADANAPVSFKLVYKLGRVCGPFSLKKGREGKSLWRAGTLTDPNAERKKERKKCKKSAVLRCGCVYLDGGLTADFKKCMKNTSLYSQAPLPPLLLLLFLLLLHSTLPECQGKTQFK